MSLMTQIRKWIYPEINLILGIDIDSDAVKISEVRYRRGIKPYFKNFAIEALPLGLVDNGYIINEAGFVEQFKEILARNYFTTKYAVAAINSRDMVLRQIELPQMTRQEVNEVLRWDLEKYVPSAANEEHYFDLHVLDENSDTKLMRVLLVAVPRRIIDSLIVVMREAGLKLLAVDHEALAFSRTVSSEGNRVVVDVDRMYTKITVYEAGVPLLSRLVALGWDRVEDLLQKLKGTSGDDSDGIEAISVDALSEIENNRLNGFIDDLTRDITRTVTYYQSTNPLAQIERFFLVGGNFGRGEVLRKFETKLRMQADSVSVFDNLSINTIFKSDYLKQYEAQLMTSIGLALWGEGNIV